MFFIFTVEDGIYVFRAMVSIHRTVAYTVRIDLGNGVEIEPQLIVASQYATAPAKPVKLGHTFAGWDYDFSRPITKDTLISAIWTADESISDFEVVATETVLEIVGVKDKAKTSYTVPAIVTSIAKGAFSECTGIKEITLPFVGQSRSMAENGYLAHIFGAGGVTEGRDLVPRTLKTVTVTEGTAIGEYAFLGCTALSRVNFPETLETIGRSAFASCLSLTSVTLPEGLTLIDTDAFYGCMRLVEVYNLSKTITLTKGTSTNGSIGRYAIDIYTDKNVESKLLTVDGYVFHVNGNTRNLVAYIGNDTALTLPEGCDGNDYKIYQYAFRESDALVSVQIPVGVTAIGRSAFSACTSLKQVTVAAGSRMTSIGASAFAFCDALESMTLPFVGATKAGNDENTHLGFLFGAQDYRENRTSVPISLTSVTVTEAEKLGEAAFYECTSLTRIELSVNVETIDWYAFYDCSALKEIVIPVTVTSIPASAFEKCTALTDVYYGGSETAWARVQIGSGNEVLSNVRMHYGT